MKCVEENRKELPDGEGGGRHIANVEDFFADKTESEVGKGDDRRHHQPEHADTKQDEAVPQNVSEKAGICTWLLAKYQPQQLEFVGHKKTFVDVVFLLLELSHPGLHSIRKVPGDIGIDLEIGRPRPQAEGGRKVPVILGVPSVDNGYP